MSLLLKCLSCGDVDGRFSALLKRLDTVSSKAGPFELILVSGSFFNADTDTGAATPEDHKVWMDLMSGRRITPVPIYLLGPNSAPEVPHFKDLAGYELCDNITYLGPFGCLSTREGLKIAYFSGAVEGAVSTKKDFQFSYEQLKSLEAQTQCGDSTFPGVDILLTTQWPFGVAAGGATPKDMEAGMGSKIVSKLSVMLRPRYHFAAKHGVHYERQPYRNHRVAMESARHVTRFIGLAKVGNTEKKKWLYAFNIKPLKTIPRPELIAQPQDSTDMPYKAVDLNSLGNPERQAQFFYDMNAPIDDRRKKGKRGNQDRQNNDQQKKPRQTGPCWFCLSGDEVEKHLVVSIGEHSYLALPKGGLNKEHVLILPIAHYQSQLDIPKEVDDEIAKFKNALRKCFKKEGKSIVFFERNYKSQHLQLQAIPLHKAVATTAKRVLQDIAESQQVELAEIPDHANLTQMVPAGAPYFYVELPDKEQMVHRVRSGFSIHFGREVLASPGLLDLEDRIDWRDCKASKEEETEWTKDFRKVFQPFDFTLEEDEEA